MHLLQGLPPRSLWIRFIVSIFFLPRQRCTVRSLLYLFFPAPVPSITPFTSTTSPAFLCRPSPSFSPGAPCAIRPLLFFLSWRGRAGNWSDEKLEGWNRRDGKMEQRRSGQPGKNTLPLYPPTRISRGLRDFLCSGCWDFLFSCAGAVAPSCILYLLSLFPFSTLTLYTASRG